MDRKQLYAEIKSLNLAEEVKARYGRNYTQVSSDDLQKLVDEAHKCLKDSEKKEVKTEKKVEKKVTQSNDNNSLEKLVQLLYKKRILLGSEVYKIFNS